MTQESIRIRGLEPGYERSPLTHFRGVLDHFEPRAQGGNWPGTRIDLFYGGVEVLASDAPYNFPITTTSIKYSDKQNSAWGVFAASLVKCIPEDKGLEDCKGHVMELKLSPEREFGTNRDTGEAIKVDVWEVLSVGGMEGLGVVKVSPTVQALSLLDGKTVQDWNQLVFADQIVKGDGALTSQILSGAFLPAMESKGVVSKDDHEVWHVDLTKLDA